MNILEILTLNKHGDFEEVLFSSLLSYLLDPNRDHGLRHLFLQKVLKEVCPDIDDTASLRAKVDSERPLGDAGKVDILITLHTKIVALEVKIWDRSAKNLSKGNERQIERYCRHISTEFKDNWMFVFLVPTSASATCLKEFSSICIPEFKDHVKLMTWVRSDPVPAVYSIPEGRVVQKSIMDLIGEILSEVKRVDLPLNTQWLLDSLYDVIPDLVEDIPEPGRFPNKSHLEKLDTWHIFESFFSVGKRWPISLHTAVGIPYGWGGQRSELHGNSLYRIRTVTDYYSNLSDMEAHLPGERVELELWPEVYEASKERIIEWLNTVGLGESAVRPDYHLDANKTDRVFVISLDKNTKVTSDNVEELNTILKEGFRRVLKREGRSDTKAIV